jgi:hypothetical protein
MFLATYLKFFLYPHCAADLMETQLNPITTLLIMYTLLLVSSPGFFKNQFCDIKKLKKIPTK